MSTIKDTEEFTTDDGDETPADDDTTIEEVDDDADEDPAPDADEKTEEEETTEDKGESEEEDPKETPPPKEEVPPKAAGKVYTYNGQQLTADEMYQQALSLQGDYTQKSQRLAKYEAGDKPEKEAPPKKESKYTKEQLDEFREFARDAGIVLAEDLQKTKAEDTQKTILNDFYAKHPEYKDDDNSKKLFGELARYNNDLKFLGRNLEDVHKSLFPTAVPSKEVAEDIKEAEIRAKQTKLNRASAGAGKGAKAPSNSGQYSPAQIEMMKKMGVYEDQD